MAEQITLDLFDMQVTNYKKEDLRKKLYIAFNIFNQCQQGIKSDKKPPPENQTALEKCSELTGVDQETLMAVTNLEYKTNKFEEWFFEQKQMTHSYKHEYCSLRNKLIESYTKNLEIPTGLKEEKKFEGYKKNFTFLQLPGTKASIIVEKPEMVQERHRFLNKKMKYVEAKKNIVYIGKINILMNNGKFSYKEDTVEIKSRFIIAASPTLGHMGNIYSCGNNQQFITNWIEEKIMPELPKGSVIIFQENVISSVGEIDNFTPREDMIHWLKCNQVNHDSKMHRADLHKLINDYKLSPIDQFAKAEDALRAHGHIALIKKKCNLNTNYFDPFWDFLIHELNAASQTLPPSKFGVKHHAFIISRTVNIVVEKSPLDYWQKLENMLLEKEREIYKEDLEMENVIDKLVTMVKHEGLPNEVKLDEYGGSAEQSHIFLANSLRNFYNQYTVQSYRGLNISK